MSNPDDDQPLSVQDSARDVTPPLSVETFDLTAYAAGHRSTRSAVLIPEKASLLGEIKKVEWRIDHAPDDENVDDLIERFEALIDEYQSAQRFWVLEARSPEWINTRRREFAKRNGIKSRRDGGFESEKDAAAVMSDQLLGQVVEIESLGGEAETGDLTLQAILALYDENAALWNLLVQEMGKVNTAVPQAEAVLTRDFSRRSSTGRSGTAS